MSGFRGRSSAKTASAGQSVWRCVTAPRLSASCSIMAQSSEADSKALPFARPECPPRISWPGCCHKNPEFTIPTYWRTRSPCVLQARVWVWRRNGPSTWAGSGSSSLFCRRCLSWDGGGFRTRGATWMQRYLLGFLSCDYFVIANILFPSFEPSCWNWYHLVETR